VDQLFNSSEKRLARVLPLLANFGKESKPEPVIPTINQATCNAEPCRDALQGSSKRTGHGECHQANQESTRALSSINTNCRAVYFSNTSSIWPTFFCTLPATFSF
jgi:hypothetical protein